MIAALGFAQRGAAAKRCVTRALARNVQACSELCLLSVTEPLLERGLCDVEARGDCRSEDAVDRRLVRNVCAMACGDARATPGADAPDPPEDEPEAQVSGADAGCDADPVAAAASVARKARPLWFAD